MKPMKKIDTYIYKLGLWAGAALSLTACVDEDCPTVRQCRDEGNYGVLSNRLATGVDPEFEAELLSLHLGFWNSRQNFLPVTLVPARRHAGGTVFQGDAPVDNYDHLAVANPQQRPRGRRSAHVRQRVGRRGGRKRPSPRTPSRLWPIRLSPVC